MRRDRYLVVGSLAIGCSAFTLVSCHRHPVPTPPIESGYQWMAWSPALRVAYVEGYISGHGLGTRELCLAEDDKVHSAFQEAANKNPPLTAPLPSSECLEERSMYTNVNVLDAEPSLQHAYADPITTFYTRHPELRGVPFPLILQQLSDRHHSTVDDLERMAQQGKLRNLIPPPENGSR